MSDFKVWKFEDDWYVQPKDEMNLCLNSKEAAVYLIKLIKQNNRFLEWHAEQGRMITELRNAISELISLARGLEEDDPYFFERRDGESVIAVALLAGAPPPSA